MKNFVLTSESTTAGHPDKLCDQVSDAIVDAFLFERDPCTVMAECAIANGIVFLSILHGTSAPVDVAETARRVIGETGYVEGPFAASTCTLLTSSNRLPAEDPALTSIHATASRAVTAFGFACRHTPTFMPYSIWCAHNIARAHDAARTDGSVADLLPDGQVQVAVRFHDRQPVEISSITVTTSTRTSHSDGHDELQQAVERCVIAKAFENAPVTPDGRTEIIVQRTIPLHTGGPAIHAGLTGRKNADDGYGGYARLSAAALSGKDPSRIDRIAAYAARHLAKCVVAAELAEECEIQLSYGIGRAEPISMEIDTFGTGHTRDEQLSARLRQLFDLRVGAIVERFDLWNITTSRGGEFYRNLAVYGQFGREDVDAPWENISDAVRI